MEETICMANSQWIIDKNILITKNNSSNKGY